MSALENVGRVLAKLEAAGLFVACVASLSIMFLVTIDVGFRYLLGAPLGWVYELISSYLTVALFFLALAASFTGKHHVRVDFFVRHRHPAVRTAFALVGVVLTSCVFAAILMEAGQHAWTDWTANAVTSGEIHWPTWIPPAIVAVGSGLLLLRLIWSIGAGVGALRSSEPLDEEPHS